MTFGHEINGLTLQAEILDAAEASEVALGEEHVTLRPVADAPDWRIGDAKGYEQWNVSLATNQESARKVFAEMERKMAETPVWPSAMPLSASPIDCSA